MPFARAPHRRGGASATGDGRGGRTPSGGILTKEQRAVAREALADMERTGKVTPAYSKASGALNTTPASPRPATAWADSASEAAARRRSRRPGSAEIVQRAVGELERVYLGPPGARGRGPYPEVLEAALRILSKSYGHTADAVQGVLVEGVGLLLHRYGDALDVSALVQKLARQETGPNGLMGLGGRRHSERELLDEVVKFEAEFLLEYSVDTFAILSGWAIAVALTRS